ncbi:MAG: carboxypeptidase M32 [Alphaproteobacteria bacterium]|jgi:carboxypeptidase Taq|nr:carboxypeptidase M32 [Alphaproteobacteria bacterium]
MTAAYADLEKRFHRLSLLSESIGMLNWDMSVMMPPESSEARGQQITALKLISHEMMADPALADALDAAESELSALDDWRTANVRRMRRRWTHRTAIPADLVEATSRAETAAETVWRTARPANDFPAILPHLTELLNLGRQAAQAKSEALGIPPYEALMDLYEPGATTAQVDELFDNYAAFLPEFLEKVLAHQATGPTPVLPDGPFPTHLQEALCHRLAEAVGFDFGTGRLDTTLHPFSGGIPEDSRITTRYDEDDFTSAMMAVLHETGHAMYERGRPAAWRYQPVGETPGLGMHESQSLIVEMQASRSREFITWAAPIARDALGGQGDAWSSDNLYQLSTRVARSFIRVDADEVTYPAHVILRYRLERAMIDGDLNPEDLPGAWSEGMKQLLGVSPPDDSQGCLQDIHWYCGMWGYFPTYTIGAMAAAQLFDAAKREETEIESGLATGDFGPLMRWLREKVHGLGARYTTNEILKKATGRALDPSAFKTHLNNRYLEKAQ